MACKAAPRRLANENNMYTITPAPLPQRAFTNPEAAWAYVAEIYHRNTSFIREQAAAWAPVVKASGATL